MKRVFSLCLLATLAGCGTIARGTSETVTVDVLPANASVRTSLGVACRGSCRIEAPRNQAFTVTASAPGYESRTVEVGIGVSLAGARGIASNVAGPSTVVGVGVDLYTGAAYDHFPNPVVIRLRPVGQPAM